MFMRIGIRHMRTALYHPSRNQGCPIGAMSPEMECILLWLQPDHKHKAPGLLKQLSMSTIILHLSIRKINKPKKKQQLKKRKKKELFLVDLVVKLP